MDFLGAQVKMESFYFSLWKEKRDRQDGSLFTDRRRGGPQKTKPYSPNRGCLKLYLSPRAVFYFYTDSHQNVKHHTENKMSLEGCFLSSPRFSCQEINMWHGISGGRRRCVGREAQINGFFNCNVIYIKYYSIVWTMSSNPLSVVVKWLAQMWHF